MHPLPRAVGFKPEILKTCNRLVTSFMGNDTPEVAAKRKWLPKAEIPDRWPTHALRGFS